MFTSLILDWVISLNDLLCRNELLYFNAIIAADVWFITSIMSDSRPSYLKALSPSYYHADLNASLEALVMGTRKNLLEALETQNYLEDECATDLNDFGEETLKVFLRIRPLTEQEKNAGEDKQCIRLKDSCTICATAPPDSWSFRNAQNLGIEKSSEFSFSRVLDVHAKQDDVFDVTALDLAKDFIVGRNVLMFCYGVTNAGKTFTIQGNEFEPGLIPRTLLFLFAFVHSDLYHDPCFLPKFANDVIVADESDKRALLQKREHLMRLADIEDFEVFLAESNLSKISSGSESSLASSCSSNTDLNDAGKSTAINSVGESFSGYKYLIWISFAEIYNEYVYDLLETLPTTEKSKRRSVLKLSEDKKGNVYLKGLTEICVSSCEEALKVLSLGQKNLRFASTKLNYNSSRSHCIYTVRLMRLTCQDDKLMVVRSSKFSFCDLAGSERTSKTGSTGERLKEAGSINTSLLNLGCCITALRYNQCHKERSQIIPFRNSKLTRLFQNFLVGRGKACMVVNISPCASSFDETWQVLQFSAIAKQVKQKSVDITLNSGPLCQIKNAANKNVKGGSEFPVGRDMENSDDSLLETTLAGDGALVQQLEVIIEDLKSQLLEERKKNLTIEQSVRNELCEKFAAQLMAMNERQIEMMDRQSDRVEDLADERIEFYVQTMKKQQNKEQRRMTMSGNYSDDEEESWVPEKVLRAERVENERLRQQIEEGRVVNEKFNNANDETAELKQQIENLTQQLAQKTKECKELDEMLGEAGSKYQENQAEIEILKKNHAIVVERLEMELVAARRETDRLKSQLTAEPRGKTTMKIGLAQSKTTMNISDVAEPWLPLHSDVQKSDFDGAAGRLGQNSPKASHYRKRSSLLHASSNVSLEPVIDNRSSDAGVGDSRCAIKREMFADVARFQPLLTHDVVLRSASKQKIADGGDCPKSGHISTVKKRKFGNIIKNGQPLTSCQSGSTDGGNMGDQANVVWPKRSNFFETAARILDGDATLTSGRHESTSVDGRLPSAQESLPFSPIQELSDKQPSPKPKIRLNDVTMQSISSTNNQAAGVKGSLFKPVTTSCAKTYAPRNLRSNRHVDFSDVVHCNRAFTLRWNASPVRKPSAVTTPAEPCSSKTTPKVPAPKRAPDIARPFTRFFTKLIGFGGDSVSNNYKGDKMMNKSKRKSSNVRLKRISGPKNRRKSIGRNKC